MNGFLYILKSSKTNKFYIGSTNNVERRLLEHITGKSAFTRDTGPYELVFEQKFETLKEARKAEYWIKKQKDRKLIENLIKNGLKKAFN